MCEIRQNQPDCRRPDPSVTHFSHSPCSLYLIFMLQPTQSNLVQCCAYSNNSQRGLNSNRPKEQAAEIKYIIVQGASRVQQPYTLCCCCCCSFNLLKQYTALLSLKSSLFFCYHGNLSLSPPTPPSSFPSSFPSSTFHLANFTTV